MFLVLCSRVFVVCFLGDYRKFWFVVLFVFWEIGDIVRRWCLSAFGAQTKWHVFSPKSCHSTCRDFRGNRVMVVSLKVQENGRGRRSPAASFHCEIGGSPSMWPHDQNRKWHKIDDTFFSQNRVISLAALPRRTLSWIAFPWQCVKCNVCVNTICGRQHNFPWHERKSCHSICGRQHNLPWHVFRVKRGRECFHVKGFAWSDLRESIHGARVDSWMIPSVSNSNR